MPKYKIKLLRDTHEVNYLGWVNAAYNVRHQVWCEKNGHIPINAERLEIDEFDANSEHFLVLEDGFVKGCGRVVLSPNLPFKEGIRLYPEYEWLYNYPDIVEVSRFSSISTRLYPQLIIASSALILCQYSSLFMAILEPRLAQYMMKSGVELEQAGEVQPFLGTRAPYVGNMEITMNNFYDNNRKAYEAILTEVHNEREKM